MPALGALTGNQAVQQVQAGLEAIYLSGWQVAADANLAGADVPRPEPLPGQLGARRSCAHQPGAAARRPDRSTLEGDGATDWFAPIVADAEAGFGGPLNAFELMKAMIEAGAAGVHFEDQLASEKKCGHLGGKVLVPTQTVHPHAQRRAPRGRRLRRADAARRAHRRRQRRRSSPATSTSATAPFLTGERTPEGFFRMQRAASTHGHRARPGLRALRRPALVRDLRRPTWTRRARFAEGDPRRASRASCWPTTARRRSTGRSKLDDAHHRALPARARRHGLQVPVRDAGRLPRAQPRHVRAGARLPRPRHGGLLASCRRPSSPREAHGYTATRHQREVGTGYFDDVAQAIAGGQCSTTALDGLDRDGAVLAGRRRTRSVLRRPAIALDPLKNSSTRC